MMAMDRVAREFTAMCCEGVCFWRFAARVW